MMKGYLLKKYKILKRSMIVLSFLFFIALVSCAESTIVANRPTTRTTYETTTNKPAQNAIVDDFKASVFRLDIKNNDNITYKQGTGYVLKEDGTFVTNAHVLEEGWEAFGRFDESQFSYEVEGIYFYDEELDIAIGKLKIEDDFELVPVEFADEYYVGDLVYSIGYPNHAVEAKVSEGKIISTYYTSNIFDMIYIRTDSFVQNGNSGGILTSEDGKVIGMTSVSFSDNTFS